jgi:hypothetical protein
MRAIRSVREPNPSEVADALNVSRVGRTPHGEHCDLQARPVGSKIGHLLLSHGLHDVVNVDRLTARMRPKAVVDLISFDKLACDLRRSPEKRPKLSRFIL